MKHNVTATMDQHEDARPMKGDSSVDDANLNIEKTGGESGRLSSNKVTFVTAVELREGIPKEAISRGCRLMAHPFILSPAFMLGNKLAKWIATEFAHALAVHNAFCSKSRDDRGN